MILIWIIILSFFVAFIAWIYYGYRVDIKSIGRIKTNKMSTSVDHNKKQQGQGECIFCQGGPMSKQHVWPDWLKNVIPRKAGGKFHKTMNGHITKSGYGRFQRNYETFEGHPGTTKVRKVCVICNNEWMSELEQEAKPFLTPLILNENTVIDKNAQFTVAKWAVMTAIVGEYIEENTRSISEEDRHYFYRKRIPPPNWKIWLAKSGSKTRQFGYGHIVSSLPGYRDIADRDTFRNNKNQFSTFIVGDLVLLIANATELPSNYTLEGSLKNKTVQIYPLTKNQLAWSDYPNLSDKEIDILASYFNNKLLDIYLGKR